MSNKILRYGLWIVTAILIVGLVGCVILLSTFDIFNTPYNKTLVYKCDYEGLRQAEMYRLEGNAVTNSSISVSVHLQCNGYDSKDEREVFTADSNSIDDDDVKIDWLTFDTLLIRYNKELRIFKQLDKVVYRDSTLSVNLTYKVFE